MNKVIRNLLAVACLTTAITASAVQAKRGFHEVQQPDGTTVKVELRGDENFHAYFTEDGLPTQRNAEGFLCYVTEEGLSTVVAHPAGVRGAEEQAFLALNANKMDFSKMVANSPRFQARKAEEQARRILNDNGPARTHHLMDAETPHEGEQHILVILTQFTDKQFLDGEGAHEVYDSIYNNLESVSVGKYFRDQSNNVYQPVIDVKGPVTVSHNYSYYGGNDWSGNDQRPGAMVAEALQLVPDLDLSLYDSDNNGEADVVIILYAGEGEASSYDSNTIWPHQWYLTSSDWHQRVNINGTYANKYACFNEVKGRSNPPVLDGIGTFCHEFSHCLGLPDFYTTNYSGYYGMDAWSLMDYGCYNGDGYLPCGYTAYEKWCFDWLDYQEPDTNTEVTLVPNDQRTESRPNQAVRLTSPNPNDFIVLEARHKEGWNADDAAEGLIAIHCAYNENRWSSNNLNNFSDQGMTILPADNQLSSASNRGDLYPYNGNDQLTDESTPATKTNSGQLYGKPVTEITKGENGAVTFWYCKDVLPDPVALEVPATHYPTTTNENHDCFTAVWDAVEGAASYTLELLDKGELGSNVIADYNLSASLPDDWTGENAAYDAEEQAVVVGDDKGPGKLISPTELQVDENRQISVVIDGRAKGVETVKVAISLRTAEGRAISSKTLTFDSIYAPVAVVFKGAIGTDYNITMATIARKKNLAVKRLRAYNGAVPADVPCRVIYEAEMAPGFEAPAVSGNDLSTVVEGLTTTSYDFTSLRPSGFYGWRVKAIAADPTINVDSPWSSYLNVDLGSLGTQTALEMNRVDAAQQIRVEGTTVYAPADARVFTPAGVEMRAAAAGVFHLSAGLYIVSTSEGSTKISLK